MDWQLSKSSSYFHVSSLLPKPKIGDLMEERDRDEFSFKKET